MFCFLWLYFLLFVFFGLGRSKRSVSSPNRIQNKMNQSVLFLILCMMSLIQPVAAAGVGDVSTILFFTLIHRLIPLQSLNRQTKKKKKHILNIIFHIQNKNNHIVMQTIENSPNLRLQHLLQLKTNSFNLFILFFIFFLSF